MIKAATHPGDCRSQGGETPCMSYFRHNQSRTTSYNYDKNSNLVWEEISYLFPNQAEDNVNATILTYCGSDSFVKQYVWGNYLDEVWTIDDRVGNTIASLNDGTGNQRHFYHCNTLYHVYANTDETGALAEAVQSYDAYGKANIIAAGADTVFFTGDDVAAVTSAIGNDFFYTGQRLDDETGNNYFKNRYQNPQIGRFLSRDPVGYKAGVGLYHFMSSSVTVAVDPLGLMTYSQCHKACWSITDGYGKQMAQQGRMTTATHMLPLSAHKLSFQQCLQKHCGKAAPKLTITRSAMQTQSSSLTSSCGESTMSCVMCACKDVSYNLVEGGLDFWWRKPPRSYSDTEFGAGSTSLVGFLRNENLNSTADWTQGLMGTSLACAFAAGGTATWQALPKMQVHVWWEGKDFHSAFQVASGRVLHGGFGPIKGLSTQTVYKVCDTFTSFSVPILWTSRVAKLEGVASSGCATSVGRAFVRGWLYIP